MSESAIPDDVLNKQCLFKLWHKQAEDIRAFRSHDFLLDLLDREALARTWELEDIEMLMPRIWHFADGIGNLLN